MNTLKEVNRIIKEINSKDIDNLKDVYMELIELRELAYKDCIKNVVYKNDSDLVVVNKKDLDALIKDSYVLNYHVDQ